MGMRQEAIEKVKKDGFEHGSPQEVLQRLLLAWIEYCVASSTHLRHNSGRMARRNRARLRRWQRQSRQTRRKSSRRRTPWRASTSTHCSGEEARRR